MGEGPIDSTEKVTLLLRWARARFVVMTVRSPRKYLKDSYRSKDVGYSSPVFPRSDELPTDLLALRPNSHK